MVAPTTTEKENEDDMVLEKKPKNIFEKS